VICGYVNIRADAEGGREADNQRIEVALKPLGVESWIREESQIRLTGGALDAFMHLEPEYAALGICQRKT
jgi:hypothetical protein